MIKNIDVLVKFQIEYIFFFENGTKPDRVIKKMKFASTWCMFTALLYKKNTILIQEEKTWNEFSDLQLQMYQFNKNQVWLIARTGFYSVRFSGNLY